MVSAMDGSVYDVLDVSLVNFLYVGAPFEMTINELLPLLFEFSYIFPLSWEAVVLFLSLSLYPHL